ncbi:unnamed protein product [Paramecium pentaurelia]|uniref:Uncharacterized protein n=1 Tax=Paramecium pentaurelia TaxID=43138 RepID=A0A8S1W3K6_9CILI|nr:unnamed protein product [Paramecium pentaurelia]
MNQILIVQFSNKIIDENYLEIRNILIIQHTDSSIYFFSKIGNISFMEFQDFSRSQNSLFYFESCSLYNFNVRFVSFYMSPILSIVNEPKQTF